MLLLIQGDALLNPTEYLLYDSVLWHTSNTVIVANGEYCFSELSAHNPNAKVTKYILYGGPQYQRSCWHLFGDLQTECICA